MMPLSKRRRVLSADNLRGVLLLKDELAGWLGNLDKYGDGDAAFYLAAYGARPHTIDRKKLDKPIRIPSLAISILGTIQPEPFSTLLLTRDDDGLQARLLPIWPDPVPPSRPNTILDHQRIVRAFRRLLVRLWSDRWKDYAHHPSTGA